MMTRKTVWIWFVVLAMGCARNEAPPPTAAVPLTSAVPLTASVPLSVPAGATATPAPTLAEPATLPLPPMADSAESPTLPAATLPPAQPTGDPAATATPADPDIRFTAPADGTVMTGGQPLAVAGIVTGVAADAVVTVALLQENQGVISVTAAERTGDGWQATLDTPADIVGPFVLVASAAATGGVTLAEETRRLVITPDDAADLSISLDRPWPSQLAVAGMSLYFSGSAFNRSRETFPVTIAVRYGNCRETAATVQFMMHGSGSWEGILTVPETVSGPACAVASVEDGDGRRRSAQVPLTILEPDDEAARGIVVIRPNPNAVVGRTFTASGMAYGANGEILLRVSRADGFVLAETSVPVSRFGQWEATLTLDGPEGAATLTAGFDDSSSAALQTLVPIVFTR